LKSEILGDPIFVAKIDLCLVCHRKCFDDNLIACECMRIKNSTKVAIKLINKLLSAE
jgi:hypothetical protein